MTTFRDIVLRGIAILGLIAVLLLGAWGIIQLAFFLPGFFSNLAGGLFNRAPAAESLAVSAPLSVVSGTAFPVSWTHKNGSGQYSYALSYSCAEGLSMKAPLPNGTFETVACNTPFNYTGAASSTGVLPVLESTKNTPATITVSATKLASGAVTTSATANITIAPAQKSATTTTPATKPAVTTKKPASSGTSYMPSGRTTNLYGQSDLAIRMTGNPGSVRAGQLVQLQFVVENVGTNITPGNWSFVAELPYNPTYLYQSGGQQALYPGDKIVYTLSYTAVMNQPEYGYGYTYPYDTQSWSYPAWNYDPYNNPSYGYQYPGYYPAGAQTQSVKITVDPYNFVWERSEANNSASVVYTIY